MTDDSSKTPQKLDSTFFDQVDINVNNLHESIIKKIDSIRSYIVVSSVKIDKNINLDKQDFDEILKKNIKKEKDPQESRCHAFYRLIGLPVVDKDGHGYNPGFDQDHNASLKFLKRKLNIYYNIDSKVISLMSRREDYYNNFIKVFGKQDINASALALSSLDKRLFSSSFQNDEIKPFDPDIWNQRHILPDAVLGRRIKSLQDVNGNSPDFGSDANSKLNEGSAVAKDILITRYHILKPFIVDPRIELSVSPSINLVSAPFMNDDTKRQIFNNVKLEIPIIEKICRQRLNVSYQDKKLGEFTQQIIDYVKNNDSFKNDKFLKKVFSDSLTNADQDQVAQYLASLFKLIIILEKDISKLNGILKKINYIPIPNEKGLEYGCMAAKLTRKDPNNTDLDNQLVNSFIKIELLNTKNSFKQETSSNVIDSADNVAGASQLQNNSKNSKAVESLDNKNFKQLKEKRNKLCNEANNLLKEIEIIMGEFSGFGLIDYYIIHIALYTISKETLINLLDDTSFSRLKKNKYLLSDDVVARSLNDNKPTFDMKEALVRFETEIRWISNLADSFYRSRIE